MRKRVFVFLSIVTTFVIYLNCFAAQNNKQLEGEPIYDSATSTGILEDTVYQYDDQGRRIRGERVSGPNMKFEGYWTYDYYGNSAVTKSQIWHNQVGVRTYQIIYDSQGRSVSHLYFDDTGAKLASFTGDIPEDIDLAFGWGKPQNGLLIGIVPNRSSSPSIKDFEIWISIKNESKNYKKTFRRESCLNMKLELRDSKGILVSQRIKHIEECKAKELMFMNRFKDDGLSGVESHQASADACGRFDLGEWYDDVSPGKYELIVKYRTSDTEFSLVSNPITIEVLEKKIS